MEGWKCWNGGTGPCCRYCEIAHLLVLLQGTAAPALDFCIDFFKFMEEDTWSFLFGSSCILPFAVLLIQRQTDDSLELTCHLLVTVTHQVIIMYRGKRLKNTKRKNNTLLPASAMSFLHGTTLLPNCPSWLSLSSPWTNYLNYPWAQGVERTSPTIRPVPFRPWGVFAYCVGSKPELRSAWKVEAAGGPVICSTLSRLLI